MLTERQVEKRWELLQQVLGAEARGETPRPFASQRTLFGIPSSVEVQIAEIVAQDEERLREQRAEKLREKDLLD